MLTRQAGAAGDMVFRLSLAHKKYRSALGCPCPFPLAFLRPQNRSLRVRDKCCNQFSANTCKARNAFPWTTNEKPPPERTDCIAPAVLRSIAKPSDHNLRHPLSRIAAWAVGPHTASARIAGGCGHSPSKEKRGRAAANLFL